MIPRRITVVSLAVATSLLGDGALYTVLPAYAEQLGIRLALVGVLLSVNRFVRLLSNSWAGNVHDRFHSPWPFVMALVVGACTTAVYGLLWGFWIFLIARLIWGICWSFLRLEGYTSVIIEAPPQSRGKLMGVYKSIVSSGFMAGGFLGGVLTDTIGYRNCLLSFSCFSLLAAFVLFLERSRNRRARHLLDHRQGCLCHQQPTSSVQHPASSIQHPVEQASRLSSRQHPDRHQSPERWMLYLMGFTNLLVSSAMISSTLGRLLKVRFGMAISFWRASVGIASAAGVLNLIRRTMPLFLAPMLGHLADRVGRRFVLISGLTTSILVILCLATQRHFVLIGLAYAVVGSVSMTSISVSLDASVADMASERQRGQLVSRYVTFADLGAACGPLISYLLLGARVSIEWVYLGGLAFLIAACVLYGLRAISLPSGN